MDYGQDETEKGDRVRVISGKDKGKEGKVLRSIPDRDLLVIEGVNMATKHVKPSQKNPQSGIVKQEGPIYASKVMLVPLLRRCYPRRPRLPRQRKKVRLCKACGEIVDQV